MVIIMLSMPMMMTTTTTMMTVAAPIHTRTTVILSARQTAGMPTIGVKLVAASTNTVLIVVMTMITNGFHFR